jgi:hypothetical protein
LDYPLHPGTRLIAGAAFGQGFGCRRKVGFRRIRVIQARTSKWLKMSRKPTLPRYPGKQKPAGTGYAKVWLYGDRHSTGVIMTGWPSGTLDGVRQGLEAAGYRESLDAIIRESVMHTSRAVSANVTGNADRENGGRFQSLEHSPEAV